MGGYGALYLAGLRPTAFCGVVGHSAALWQSGGDSAPGAFDDAAAYAADDVFESAAQGRYRALPVWIDVGDRDPFRAADAAFATLLRRHDVRVRFHEWPGGHAQAYWHAHMIDYLRFYAAALADCSR